MTQDITKNGSSEIAQSRARFEKEFSPFLVMDRNELGYYRATGTQRAWEGWQAAERDSLERISHELKAEIAARKKWQQLAEYLYENANIELAERIRGKE